jgi:type I restriction enzyme S subunit
MSSEAMQVKEASASYLAKAEAQDMPPGYKRTEAGVIPTDWKSVPFGEVVDLLTGFPFPSAGYANSGVLLVRGSNVKRGALDWNEDITKYWPAVTSDISRYELREGDLVIAMDGALVGRSYATISRRDLPSLLLQRVARIRSSIVYQPLLGCWVASDYFIQHVDSVKTHTAIPHISPSDIRNFRIAAPTNSAEQRAIAEALSDVDGLLGALEAIIAKKRAIKQAAMQQFLTGKTRFPGFSGEWETKRLGEHVAFLRNGVNSRAELTTDGPVKYLHYGDIHTSSKVRLDPRVTAMPSLPEERARALDRLQDGDLVFADASEDMDGVGRSVEIQGVSEIEVVAGLHTIAARFDKAVLADGFKAYLQFCPAFREQLRRLAAGTKVYATNRSQIASIEMRLPDTKEQTAIATVLSDMDNEIAALEARRDKTRALKQGMMQQLLTGRVRFVKPESQANKQ